ncbi:MAG: XTP/dITP diphosphatase [Clostridia bacterium]|nr:XTP/dITP diphosphatase [Clostridia bacterium]MDY5264516.1 XTP/dITP diphosphatase [Eubacteriales bacterium]MDY5440179.1 XTP/dITP diphosphatase [Eubacteriales bacterium]
MELVIASNNQNKVREIKQIIGDKFTKIYSLKELGVEVDVEETGATFFENSLIKAKAITEITGKASLADDSGLVVDVLGGAPGVYSARFAGEPCNDENNNDKLLKLLEGVKYEDKTARFVSVVTLYYPNGEYVFSEGSVEGHVLSERRGDGGFGYDPLFYCDKLGKTFGEASQEEKNLVSHRANALSELRKKL